MFVLVLASSELLIVLPRDSISSTFSSPTSQHDRSRLKLRSPTVAFDNAHLSDRALERVWRLCVLEVKREGHRLMLSSEANTTHQFYLGSSLFTKSLAAEWLTAESNWPWSMSLRIM